MNKHDLIQKFFSKGILLSPGVLEHVLEEHLSLEHPPLILTSLPTPFQVEYPEERKTLTVQDISHFYLEKYKGIQQILLEKISPLSISNAAKKFEEVSLIGIVRERTPSGYIVEDQTGWMDVFSSSSPPNGDVLGIVGYVREGKLFEKERIYPDVPLPKDIKTPDLTFFLKKDGQEISCGSQRLSLQKCPAKIQFQGVEIIFAQGGDHPLEWLKKRHLPEKITSPSDFYLIDHIPDILWVLSQKDFVDIYKGVLIVGTGEHSAKIDMKTKEVTFLDI